MSTPVATLLKQYRWPLVNAVLGLLCLMLAFIVFGGGDEAARKALEEGRRIAIDLETGEIFGNPASLPKKPAPKQETPPVAAVAPTEEYGPPSPAISPALPGNFVGEKLESQEKPAEEADKYEYPMAVKQEPQSRQMSESAPPPLVQARDLLESAPEGRPLPVAPQDDLQEVTKEGLSLPKIGAKGARAWQAYAKEVEASAKEPVVAVVVTGLGLGTLATQSAFKLEEHFTFSFSPYGKEVAMWAKQARTGGHEVLVDFPMQTSDYPASDPGPWGLITGIKPQDNKARLHQVLSRFAGFIGLTAPIGAALPANTIMNCLSDVAARGLLMLEPPQSGDQLASSQKKQLGLVSITADYLIDGELEEGAIRAKLAELAAKAKKDGQALGYARPYPITLELLQKWQKELAAQGVRLVPVSVLAKRQ